MARWASSSGCPDDSMSRSCSLRRSRAGCRALTELTRPGVRSSATAHCVSSGPCPRAGRASGATVRGLDEPPWLGAAPRRRPRWRN
eukprot:2559971-Alexandrium_andersonii.AAC.2